MDNVYHGDLSLVDTGSVTSDVSVRDESETELIAILPRRASFYKTWNWNLVAHTLTYKAKPLVTRTSGTWLNKHWNSGWIRRLRIGGESSIKMALQCHFESYFVRDE